MLRCARLPQTIRKIGIDAGNGLFVTEISILPMWNFTHQENNGFDRDRMFLQDHRVIRHYRWTSTSWRPGH